MAFTFLLLFARGLDWHDHPHSSVANALLRIITAILVAPGYFLGQIFPDLIRWHHGIAIVIILGLMWGAVLIWLIRKLYSRIWKR